MESGRNEDVTNRMNKLATESTQTLIDAAYMAQQQSAQLMQAWLNTLDANQQQRRDIATRLLRQSQEAQQVLQEYVQESMRAGTGAFNQAADAGAMGDKK
ncbi:MAG: hypothetical protein ACR2JC_12145 [Chloroflexota bacterium]|nr:MAG: hypothetical protein DLM70_17475 [Chloroflexota bacterium]